VEEEGSVVVLSKLFGDIIRKLPNEPITIEKIEENNILIRCSSSEFTIVGLSPDEFPNIGEIENTHKIILDKDIFRDMIKKTVFSASIDESKGIIVGSLIEMEENSMNMVALDGFRMAVARENIKSGENKKIIVSAKILNEINKIITETEDTDLLEIIIDNKKAVILLQGTKIVLRLLDGEFIKYREITPKEHKTSVVVNKGDLLESVERASLLAKEGKNNLIKLSIHENKITITSRSEEGNVKEEVLISKDGENLEIGFNSKYLIEALKVIGMDEVRMEFNTSISPCLIKPIEGNEFEYLILPVRLTGN
jgi:DNA polymerase-3 subunit beta